MKQYFEYYIEKFREWSARELPPLKVGCAYIENPKLMFETHLEILEANKGNERFKPYLQRLMNYKCALENTPTLTL